MNGKRIATLVLGWALVALGVVGLFVPILQGVLFLFIGLLILSKESETAHRLAMKLRQRYPRVDEKLQRLRERFSFARQVGTEPGTRSSPGGGPAEECGGDGCDEQGKGPPSEPADSDSRRCP